MYNEVVWSVPEDKGTMAFLLDGIAYRAVEDPDDGYRNGLERIDRLGDAAVSNPFDPVRVIGYLRTERIEDVCLHRDHVLELWDAETGELVLEVGTADIADYYPSYVASFYPQAMATNVAAH